MHTNENESARILQPPGRVLCVWAASVTLSLWRLGINIRLPPTGICPLHINSNPLSSLTVQESQFLSRNLIGPLPPQKSPTHHYINSTTSEPAWHLTLLSQLRRPLATISTCPISLPPERNNSDTRKSLSIHNTSRNGNRYSSNHVRSSISSTLPYAPTKKRELF